MALLLPTLTRLVWATAPDYEYRWTESVIRHAAYLADLAVCEATDAIWASHDITLQSLVWLYPLPGDMIVIDSVQYARDGVNFDAVLEPVAISDLDDMHIQWTENTGYPVHYAVMGVPGIEERSSLVVWRKLATADGEKVRVNYTKCRNELTDIDTLDVPDHVIQQVYLPYVLSALRAGEAPGEAEAMYATYKRGVAKARAALQHRWGEPVPRLDGGML